MPNFKTSSSGGSGNFSGSGQPSGGGQSSSTIPKVGPQKIGSSGGFYKYRYKNFYTHDCTELVYVKDATCTPCLVSPGLNNHSRHQRVLNDLNQWFSKG